MTEPLEAAPEPVAPTSTASTESASTPTAPDAPPSASAPGSTSSRRRPRRRAGAAPTSTPAALAHLPGHGRAGAHRGQRRQRRRRYRHLRLGRVRVRLQHAVRDGAHHRRAGGGAGDVGPPGGLHRRRPDVADPRAVPVAPGHLRRGRPGGGQRGPGRVGVRRHRRRLRAVRRVALPVHPHRRGGHHRRGGVRLLPLRRAGLPVAERGLRGLSHRRGHEPPGLEGGGAPTWCGPTSRRPRPTCCWWWPSSGPPSPLTCSCTRRRPWPTGASIPRSTPPPGSTR